MWRAYDNKAHQWERGNNVERGLGRFILSDLKWVYAINVENDNMIPILDIKVIGTPNTIEVATMANNRRIQFKAAWWTTESLLKTYVDARLFVEARAEETEHEIINTI